MPPRKSHKKPTTAKKKKTPPKRLAAAPAAPLASTDPLRQYLGMVRQYELLTPEEEKNLAIRFQETGDKEALFRLVTGNLRLVVRIAIDFHRAFTHLLDLIQEGNIGLLQAIKRYDPFRGTKISTYATWWIRAYIIKYLLDNWSIVKVGTTNLRRKLFFNLKKEKEKLEKLGFDAGPKLLAESFGATEQDVIDVSRALDARDLSLDAPLPLSEKGNYYDIIPDEKANQEEDLERKQLRELVRTKLRALVRKLPKREREVYRMRMMAEEPKTLQELADRFGITREGVRQIETRVKKKIEAELRKDPQLARELESR